MTSLIIYGIGAVIALILGLIILFKEESCLRIFKEENDKLQIEMLAPLTLLSWISVVLIAYRLIKDKNCLA